MHSRIFQISDNPITEENLIEESNYDGNESFDYVVTSNEIKKDLQWLQGVTQGLEINIKEKTITIKSKREYFSKKHDTFIELAEKLSSTTLDEFIKGKNISDFINLKDAYEEEHAFYIDDNYECFGLTTLDNWVRNAEENKAYYIGNIFDYHI